MSSWTYVNGVVCADIPGRTQAECRYILETVLDHLPEITGSEGNACYYIIQKQGHNTWRTCDEFHNISKLHNGDFKWQSQYIIVINGSLRDREFEETLKEVNKWLCRLCKRIHVNDILININDAFRKSYTINEDDAECNGNAPYISLGYTPGMHEERWYEYLRWSPDIDEEGRTLIGKPTKGFL